MGQGNYGRISWRFHQHVYGFVEGRKITILRIAVGTLRELSKQKSKPLILFLRDCTQKHNKGGVVSEYGVCRNGNDATDQQIDSQLKRRLSVCFSSKEKKWQTTLQLNHQAWTRARNRKKHKISIIIQRKEHLGFKCHYSLNYFRRSAFLRRKGWYQRICSLL